MTFFQTSIATLIFFFSSASLAAQCPRSLDNAYASRDGEGFYYVVDFPKAAVNAKPHSRFHALSQLQETAKKKTSVDPFDLLKQQLRFYLKMPEIRKRFELIIDQKVGSIRSINCLESFLYDSHLKRFSRSSEFQVFSYTRSGHDKIRLLVTSQDDSSSVSSGRRILKLREDYLKIGWKLNFHLHNHPFAFDNPYGDVAGTVIPSEPDSATYRTLKKEEGLKEALLTNGFSTFVLKASEFNRL